MEVSKSPYPKFTVSLSHLVPDVPVRVEDLYGGEAVPAVAVVAAHGVHQRVEHAHAHRAAPGRHGGDAAPRRAHPRRARVQVQHLRREEDSLSTVNAGWTISLPTFVLVLSPFCQTLVCPSRMRQTVE